MTHSGFPKIAWIRDSLSIRRKFSILPQLPKGRLLISPRALQSKTDIRQLVPKDSQPWGGGVGVGGHFLDLCYKKGKQKTESPSLDFKPTRYVLQGISPDKFSSPMSAIEEKALALQSSHQPQRKTAMGGLCAVHEEQMWLLVERALLSLLMRMNKRTTVSCRERNLQSIQGPRNLNFKISY